jgi:dTMP kinase
MQENEKGRGKFIVIEGLGGSGKTTQIDFVSELLTNNGFENIKTREPGGVGAAEETRKLIFELREQKLIGPEGQMVLFFAARNSWMNHLVKPKLDEGISVITDRAHTSTGAYQGYAEGGDMNQILGISKIVMNGYKPDAVILLDICAETSQKRKVDKEGDPFDKESLEYFKRLENGYRQMAKDGWGELKWYVVDAESDISEVSDRIKNVLEDIFQKKLQK